MGKGLHRFFKDVENEINNALTNLGESDFEASYFIPEPRNFADVTILPADVKNARLKENSKRSMYEITNSGHLFEDELTNWMIYEVDCNQSKCQIYVYYK